MRDKEKKKPTVTERRRTKSSINQVLLNIVVFRDVPRFFDNFV